MNMSLKNRGASLFAAIGLSGLAAFAQAQPTVDAISPSWARTACLSE